MSSKMKKWILRLARDSRLQTKMIAACFLLLFIPSSIFTLYASRHVKAVVQEQTFSAARKAFEEAEATLDVRIGKMISVMDNLRFNTLLYRMVSAEPADYARSDQLEDLRSLTDLFDNLQDLSDVSSIRLYVRNDYLYSREGRYVFSMDDITDDELVRTMMDAPGNYWFTPLNASGGMQTGQPLFSCLRPIFDPGTPSSPLAILCVDLAQAELEQAIFHSATTKNGTVMLLDGTRQVISYGDETARPLPEGIFDELAQSAHEQWDRIRVDGDDYYVYGVSLAATSWRLATVIPLSDITSVSTSLQNRMLAVTLLVTVAAFLISICMSNSFTKRIGQLEQSMGRVEAGDVSVHLASGSNDELGRLIGHFNHMVSQLDQLMEEKVNYGVALKAQELKALQAQINPHFLYNTLDTINCLALQKNVPEIRQVVTALAAFYKISLSNGEDQIPIREEVRHARMYLTILDYRFADRIKTQWSIAPEIEDCPIVKIVLQPLIENAAIHGIFEKTPPSGHITVRGWRDGGDVFLTVADDGVGMDADTLRANFLPAQEDAAALSGGYGIRNINERLRIFYGAGYGLSCVSAPGRGTAVTIRIPAQGTEDPPAARLDAK